MSALKETIEKGEASGLLPIFVYGTLLKGFGNYSRFLAPKEPIGKATIHARMLSLGGFPGIYDLDRTMLVVQGEVYMVTEDELRAIDRLEGYYALYPERGLYNRLPTTAVVNAGDAWEPLSVQTYVFNTNSPERYEPITTGSWREFTSARSWQQRLE